MEHVLYFSWKSLGRLKIGMVKKPIIFGYASGMGAEHSETAEGPEFIKQKLIKQYPQTEKYWGDIIFPSADAETLRARAAIPEISKITKILSCHSFDAVTQNKFPIVIGGEHTSAIGTWSGIAAAYKSKGPLGLLWFDAHMDSHVVATSPHGWAHGMPVAALLGYGARSLTTINNEAPKLLPQHICLIGIRSYEAAEKDFLETLNVRVYYIEEVKARGLYEVIKEARQYIASQTVAYGISIDIDGFDATEVPGVGTPEPDGIRVKEFLNCLSLVENDEKLAGLEITEYNPILDKDEKTYQVVRDILNHFLPLENASK